MEKIKNYLYALKLMMKLYPQQFAYTLVLNSLSSALSFFSYAYMLRYIVNGLQTETPIIFLLGYVAVMLVLKVLLGICNEIFANEIKPVIDRKSEAKLNKTIYRRSLEIDYASFENPVAFELYNCAVTNGSVAAKYALQSIQDTVSNVLELSLNSWLLFTIDPVLFIFALIPLLLNLFIPKLQKMSYEYSVEQNEINRKRDYTRRSFYQVEFAKEMRLTKMYRVMYKRFAESCKDFLLLVKNKGLKITLVSFFIRFGIGVVTTLGAEVYTLYCTLVSGMLMYGDCLTVLTSVGNLANPASSIGDIISLFNDTALYIQDYRRFMTEEPKVKTNPYGKLPIAGDIEMRDVSFRYDGADTYALKNISLKIKKGERIAIVGNNGSGKTTLVKMLLRLYDPTNGEIWMGGEDIRNYRLHEYRRTYGVVFQDYKQMSMTVAANVLGKPYSDEDEKLVVDSLEMVGLLDCIREQPNGIQSVVTREFDENGLVLSGGQSQKLAIAAIYSRNANTIVLDEPSSALDSLAEHDMYKKLMDASEGKTVIFISHRLSSTISADRVLYMESGKIIESGSHTELMKLNGKYAELFRIQARDYTDNVGVVKI